MTQDQLLVLMLKVVLVSGAVSTAAFVVQYNRLAKWWTTPIGRTIVIECLLMIACMLPSILSLFLHFSRLTSHVAAWTDIVLFGMLTPVMLWRAVVFQRIHDGRQAEDAATEAPRGAPAQPSEAVPGQDGGA